MSKPQVSSSSKKGNSKNVQKPLDVPPVVAENNPFTAFVASQQKAEVKAEPATPETPPVTTTPTEPPADAVAKAVFVRTEQNGRKDYTPNSIGALIWATADKLQALNPTAPVNAAAVRVALPNVKASSISCGLSHWRKFHGTLRVKGAAPAPAAPAISETAPS